MPTARSFRRISQSLIFRGGHGGTASVSVEISARDVEISTLAT
ncbi:MAG: hypothetical protein AAFM92_09930 [Pseudomonadota bacterium]